ncbi:ADP-ribosylation factor-binding protein GGA3a isoform X2 [Brachyhypopomus gauderio]
MLKRQGIVTSDPEIPADQTLIAFPPERPRNPVFDNEEKSKHLAELLKSKKPEDLEEANRLIKTMVKEDEVRAQKESHRTNTLLEVNTSVKLLNEMLCHFNREQATQADRELLKDLHDDCDKLRTAVFKMATETEDDDSRLGEILQASDDLSRVINTYKTVVEGLDTSGCSPPERTNNGSSSEILIDLAGLNAHTPSPPDPPLPGPQIPRSIPADLFLPDPVSQAPHLCSMFSSGHTSFQSSEKGSPNRPIVEQMPNCTSLLDEELLSLGLSDPVPVSEIQMQDKLSHQQAPLQTPNPMLDLLGSSPPSDLLVATESTSKLDSSCTPESLGAAAALPSPGPASSVFSSLQDLALLDLGQPSSGPTSLSGSILAMGEGSTSVPSRVDGALPAPPYTSPPNSTVCPDSPLLQPLSPPLLARQGTASPLPDPSLASVFVPLDAIRPSREGPVTAYDKDGVCVLLHFASDCPPVRPDVLVMVVSMLNTAPLLVKNVTLQAAVPKSMRVKLQPPSGTELAPFNPILPPSAITQVLLLANPQKEKVRMRYKLTFVLGDRQCTETGEVDTFPPVDRWGRL